MSPTVTTAQGALDALSQCFAYAEVDRATTREAAELSAVEQMFAYSGTPADRAAPLPQGHTAAPGR